MPTQDQEIINDRPKFLEIQRGLIPEFKQFGTLR